MTAAPGLTRAIVVAASGLCLLAATDFASAGGETVLVSAYPPQRGASSTGVSGTEVSDDITARLKASRTAGENGEYTISDPAGVTPGENCISETPTVAHCPQYAAGSGVRDVFAVLLAGGDDQFVRRGAFHSSSIYGGTGGDQVSGGFGRDRVFGEGGRDQLDGRTGNDRLDAGPQSDEVLGGAGNDRLYAADDERDKVIDCGPGDHDVAHIDRDLDPAPIDCERVQAE